MRPWIALLLPGLSVVILGAWLALKWEVRRLEDGVASEGVEILENRVDFLKTLADKPNVPSLLRARMYGLLADWGFAQDEWGGATKYFEWELEILLSSGGQTQMRIANAAKMDFSLDFDPGRSGVAVDQLGIEALGKMTPPVVDDSGFLPPPTDPIPEGENAFPIFELAGDPVDPNAIGAFIYEPESWETNRDKIRQLLDANSEQLTLVHRAVERTRWQPVDGKEVHEADNIQSLCDLLILEFLHHCQEGDFDSAHRSYDAAIRIWWLMEDSPGLVQTFISISKREELTSLAIQILEIYPISINAAAGMQSTILKNRFRKESAGLGIREDYRDFRGMILEEYRKAPRTPDAVWLEALTKQKLLRIFSEIHRRVNAPEEFDDPMPKPDIAGEFLKMHALVRSLAYHGNRDPNLPGELALAKIGVVAELTAGVCQPNIGRIGEAALGTSDDEIGLAIALAAAEFRSKNGHLPEDLSELALPHELVKDFGIDHEEQTITNPNHGWCFPMQIPKLASDD